MQHIIEDHGTRAGDRLIEETAGAKSHIFTDAAFVTDRDFASVHVHANETRSRQTTGEQVGQQTLATSEIKHERCAVEQAREEFTGIERLFEQHSAETNSGAGVGTGEREIKHGVKT